MLQRLINRQPYREKNVQVSNPDTVNWHHSAELVVAGFGGAGAAAALEGHEQGLDTLVLDRLEGGGATNISGGVYYAGGGTRIQQEAGVEDSADNMFNYLKLEVQGAVSDETLKDFCDQSVDNFNWMESHGVPFEASFCEFKTSYPPDHLFFYYSGNESFPPYSDHAVPAARGHRGHKKGISGAAIYQPLKRSAVDKNIRIKTQTKVVGLITNTNGDVIGLKALQFKPWGLAKGLHKLVTSLSTMNRYNALFWPTTFNLFGALSEKIETLFGQPVNIRATKGVVLATGGFYCNQRMIKQHAPSYAGGSPLGTMADDGSGIQLAMDLGAKTDLLDSVSAWRFINPPMSLVKGVLVGPSGQRVCNEMLYGAQVGEQMMKHHDGKAYVIVDQATRSQVPSDLTLKKGLWFHVLMGYFFLYIGSKKADTIPALAKKLGISPGSLSETINDYNQIANSDQPDPKGKPKDYMPALGAGPYYAINASYDYNFVPCASLTLGGLRVEESSGLVLREDGSTIKGLYAAGRTAVGIPSRGYVSGLSIADCIFSGRRAARHATQA